MISITLSKTNDVSCTYLHQEETECIWDFLLCCMCEFSEHQISKLGFRGFCAGAHGSSRITGLDLSDVESITPFTASNATSGFFEFSGVFLCMYGMYILDVLPELLFFFFLFVIWIYPLCFKHDLSFSC